MKTVATFFIATVATLLLVVSSPSRSHAAGLASSGKEISIKWCSSCHLVTDTQKNASVDIPSFGFIAEKYRKEIDALGAFLADPHPPMPNLSLTRQEIQDLMAYISSLK